MPNFPELPTLLELTTPWNPFRTGPPAPHRLGGTTPSSAFVNLDQRGSGSSGNGVPRFRHLEVMA